MLARETSFEWQPRQVSSVCAGVNSEKAEVAGQIMSAEVYAARTDTPISELVHHLSEKGLHHVPVLDEKRRVLGMVTQSDVVAALYKRIALSTA